MDEHGNSARKSTRAIGPKRLNSTKACGRLKDVDYISGVSGGTYAATAFASHVVAAGKPDAGEELDGWYLRIIAKMKLRSTFKRNM